MLNFMGLEHNLENRAKAKNVLATIEALQQMRSDDDNSSMAALLRMLRK
jgi:hypothetical protein